MCDHCVNGINEKETWDQLHKIISDHQEIKGALIPVLHEAQEVFGYLPMEVQLEIANGLGLPLAEVYGVVSFYTQFSTKPKGKYRIHVCMGTACYVKGSSEILNKFMTRLEIGVGDCTEDQKFSLEACRCIGACGLAPVVTINDEVFGKLKPEDVDAIIDRYEKL